MTFSLHPGVSMTLPRRKIFTVNTLALWLLSVRHSYLCPIDLGAWLNLRSTDFGI